ncbi:hypothetical protein SAMN05192559_106234 [Halobacillus karajensis]|uniref:Uncharacterized protein n=1 Tax=Halobacillus karajensis TaxID=195088 RepID=A0A024P7P5_9BACI|nr:hypothetical protein [Halobacillus karajensis]CDQ20966.1 hypothetical protein BN982_03326 [Halobacillus karajensis]CDQ24970.1 hypothetical protein BN983_03271 [Halobacillus karajensis]CDQ28669.1 hypothetical protein BN981_02981 [Halobacillus karajensis]SEH97934.1 hypothetical protein SAMN05192559_106234 [Halobacillus karajensis]
MSDHREFEAEREKIDFLLEKGYVIKGVTENLSGAFLEFEYKGNEHDQPGKERLHILHPDSRKYFSTILVQQQKKQGVK